MPLNGFKSVTVPEAAYSKAKQLAKLGIEESIGKAFEKAITEYAEKRQGLVNEITEVKKNWEKKDKI